MNRNHLLIYAIGLLLCIAVLIGWNISGNVADAVLGAPDGYMEQDKPETTIPYYGEESQISVSKEEITELKNEITEQKIEINDRKSQVTVEESEITERKSLGEFRITVYTPEDDCGKWGYDTATPGADSIHLHTCAVDPEVIPLCTVIEVGGMTLLAIDTGSAVKGRVLDIFFDGTREQAVAWQAEHWGDYAEVFYSCEE